MTDLHPEIGTTSGRLIGERAGNTNRWLGVPYAVAPTGDKRWKTAEPLHTPDVIRHTTQFGSISWQPRVKAIPVPEGVRMSEDCLNLNIWAPAQPGATPRPVMVWVHGGASFVGFSSQRNYNGQKLCEEGDVIVVTINYRLGVLGFLDFTEFNSAEDPRPAFERNLGLKDIVTALHWVRDNIEAFGGDPHNVTLFGESAGGAAVTTLMTVPSACGLFHRAIAQSPPTTSVYGEDRAKRITRTYLDLLGIAGTTAQIASALKGANPQTLTQHTMALINHLAYNEPGTLAFAPVVDGDFLPEHPVDVFLRGDQAKVPFIIGSTRDEAALFLKMESPIMPTDSSLVGRMFDLLSQEEHTRTLHPRTIESAYPQFPKQQGALQISTDAGIRMPAVWFAAAHSNIAPTYMYRFDYAIPMLKVMGLGAMHGTELPYVFGTLPLRVRPRRTQWMWVGGLRVAKRISAQIRSHWLNFAHSGDPNTHQLTGTPDRIQSQSPLWLKYDSRRRFTMMFDAHTQVISDPDHLQRQAWGDTPIGFR